MKNVIRFFVVKGPNPQASRFLFGSNGYVGVCRVKVFGNIYGFNFWTPAMRKKQGIA